ncbi:MAG: hypothetical protein F4X51_22815 [Gemmatimonadetes bacterium]|nr:hypothetical protein [Gemmatimonadota bacterium]MYD62855.1 hypothetical protein [Gemmatimonadota bacterium]
MMFDYLNAAQRIGLTDGQLNQLCNQVRTEFPDDDMMFELHVLRAILAVESGRTTLNHILKGPEVQPPVA